MYMKYVHVHLLGINDLGIACLLYVEHYGYTVMISDNNVTLI